MTPSRDGTCTTSGDEGRTTMQGYVYVQTNDSDANEVVVYRHDDDGRLERLGSYLTGGQGSGTAHLPSQSRQGFRVVVPARRRGSLARERRGRQHAQRGVLGRDRQ